MSGGELTTGTVAQLSALLAEGRLLGLGMELQGELGALPVRR